MPVDVRRGQMTPDDARGNSTLGSSQSVEIGTAAYSSRWLVGASPFIRRSLVSPFIRRSLVSPFIRRPLVAPFIRPSDFVSLFESSLLSFD